MAEMIKVLWVRPGEYAQPIEIENTMENLKMLVGGYIETVYPWKDNACIVCDEEGKLKGSEMNRPKGDDDILCGNFVVCSYNDDKFGGLTPEQMKVYEREYHAPCWFFRTNRRMYYMECTPAKCKEMKQLYQGLHRTEPDREER